VFDSVTGTNLLIPGGTRAICTYNAEVVQGQERLLLAFTRLIYPSGASVQLGAMQGADMAGAIGAPAEVNARFWKTFGSTFLVAAVTRMAEGSSTSNVTVNVGAAAGGVAANVLAEVARKSLERNLNTKPELRVHAGDRLTLVVTQDMVLDPAMTQVAQP
jgi:type IV secretion system protein VirB10